MLIFSYITYSFINVKTERLTLQYNLSRRTATMYMWLVPTLPSRTATNDTAVTQDSHNQPQPGLALRLPNTDGAKVLPTSDQVGVHLASTLQMAPWHTSDWTGLLLIYRPRKDERLSWPSWLTCSGRFTHIVVTRSFLQVVTSSVIGPKSKCLSLHMWIRPHLFIHFWWK